MAISAVKITKKTGQLGVLNEQPDGLHVLLGSCSKGNFNELNFFDDITSLIEKHGSGPLVEAAAFSLVTPTGENNTGRPVGCLRLKTSTVGAISDVTKTLVGTATGTITVALTSGETTPFDKYEVIVEITRTGTTGTGAFRYSLDSGKTYSGEYAIPGGGAYDLPNTGLTVTFVPGAGAVYFEDGDLHVFETTAPSSTAQDLADGITALAADERTWNFWHLVGPPAPSLSAVTATGTTPPTVTVTGTPTDYYQASVEITTGGTRGTAVLKYSLDGGTTYKTGITTAATYLIPGTGITLNFATGTYATDNVYTFNSANAAGVATLAGLCQTHCNTLNSANRFVFAVMEASDATDAQLIAALAATSAPDVAVCAGFEKLRSAITQQEDKRSSAWSIASRLAATEAHVDPGQFDLGPLQNVLSISRDERKTPNLETARLATLRTFVGETGFYVTSCKMLGASGSDVEEAPNLRVLNRACQVTYKGLLKYLRKFLIVNKSTGKLLETEARAIEIYLTGLVNAALTTQGKASGCSVTVNRTDNILSTKKLRCKVSVIPLAYANQIEAEVGLLNPALVVV